MTGSAFLVLLAALAGAGGTPHRVTLAGVSFAAPGFERDGEGTSEAWLVEPRLGLELHVSTGSRREGSTLAGEVQDWLEGFVEEAGFRKLGASESDRGGARVIERLYGSAGGGPAWRTHAALVLGARRAVELTLLVPPGRGPEGEAAFRAVLASLVLEPLAPAGTGRR